MCRILAGNPKLQACNCYRKIVNSITGASEQTSTQSATAAYDAHAKHAGKREGIVNTSHSSRRKRARQGLIGNIVTAIVFLIGLSIFVYPLFINYFNYREQAAAIEGYDAVVAKLTPEEIQAMWNEAIDYNIDLGTPSLKDPFQYKNVEPPLDRYAKTLNVDSKGMMAYLDVPKINLKMPVYHGTSDEVLLQGAGHIATTQLPTTQASVHPVLTGHTGETGHIFFDNITQLEKGDIFQLTVLNRHMSYQVDSISIIKPTDTQALQPELGKNRITLLTCYPYGINDHRYLVRAQYIGDNVAPTAPSGVPVWVMWLLLIALLITAIIIWRVNKRRYLVIHELALRQSEEPQS